MRPDPVEPVSITLMQFSGKWAVHGLPSGSQNAVQIGLQPVQKSHDDDPR